MLRTLLAGRNEKHFIVFLPLLYWWKNPVDNLEIFTKIKVLTCWNMNFIQPNLCHWSGERCELSTEVIDMLGFRSTRIWCCACG